MSGKMEEWVGRQADGQWTDEWEGRGVARWRGDEWEGGRVWKDGHVGGWTDGRMGE